MQKQMPSRVIIIVMKSGAPLLGLAKSTLTIIIMAIVNFMSDHTYLSPIIHAFDGSILWLVREKKEDTVSTMSIKLCIFGVSSDFI